MKTEFGGKIRDRILDRSACSRFPVSVLARKIIAECVMDFLQLAQESFVLRNFLQTRLPRELEHPHRVVIGPVPKLRVEMTKQATRRGLPRPPKIEAHLAQRLERRRQSRSYVISLKGRHGRSGKWKIERELIKKMSRGKLCRARPADGRRFPHSLAIHRELIAVHNTGQSCRYCTIWVDGFNGIYPMASKTGSHSENIDRGD